MTTVATVAAWMEEIAPSSLAEEWDNVGLLLGDPAARVDRIMTCLTVTPRTATEAIERAATLIVSHHPILFRPVQKIRGDDPQGAMLWSLARAGISVISHHTASDNAIGGMNDVLARRLGLVEIGPLKENPPGIAFKVVVFTPNEAIEGVRAAAFEAGAGRIGDYERCSFSTAGRGTFLGGEGTHPAIGLVGREETVEEWKFEVVCPESKLKQVLSAIRRAHPYEEPAIDVIPTRSSPAGPGVGRIGRLTRKQRLDDFAAMVASGLDAPGTQVVGEADRLVETVAIACGAGDGFLKDAVNKADVFLTGEARFHRGLEAESAGIGLVVVGHHATERPGVEDLAVRLGETFPMVEVWASDREIDPFRSLSAKKTPEQARGS